MTHPRGFLVGVLGTAAMLIAVAASAVTAAPARATHGDASEATASASAPRCLTWRRRSPTKAYGKGRTAG